jgi:hypothetical protein
VRYDVTVDQIKRSNGILANADVFAKDNVKIPISETNEDETGVYQNELGSTGMTSNKLNVLYKCVPWCRVRLKSNLR